jgi:hypothetical protein
MILQKDQFPITIQAYEITGNTELFIAEQVVNNQSEVDIFSTRYAGKLIKAKALSTSAASATSRTSSLHTRKETGKSSAATIIIVILIILIILAVIGYYTGWLQRTLGLNI